MNSPELVAFIPVDRATAKIKGWHEMPLEGLVTALVEKTKGRLLQADLPYAPDGSQASQDFHRALKQTPLFFEHAIPI